MLSETRHIRCSQRAKVKTDVTKLYKHSRYLPSVAIVSCASSGGTVVSISLPQSVAPTRLRRIVLRHLPVEPLFLPPRPRSVPPHARLRSPDITRRLDPCAPVSIRSRH